MKGKAGLNEAPTQTSFAALVIWANAMRFGGWKKSVYVHLCNGISDVAGNREHLV